MTGMPLRGSSGTPLGSPSVVAGRVSVVIPAYNCAETLAPTLESCFAQHVGDLEVLVVNDGSTDRTAEILAGFGTRVRVIHQKNAGLAAARNAGQRASTGEFIAWMDGDDLMAPDRLELEVAVLNANPEIGVVSSEFSAFVDPAADVIGSYGATYYAAFQRLGGAEALYPQLEAPLMSGGRAVRVRSGAIHDLLVWGNFVHPPTVLARRSILEASGFADEGLRFSSDYDLILRMARKTRFAFVEAPLLRYRLSSSQMSHVNAGERMQLETARVLERLKLDDPEAAGRLRQVIRLRVAESYVHAADAVGSEDRIRAFGLLVRGLRTSVVVRPAARALARIIVPAALVPRIKRFLNAVPIRTGGRVPGNG